MNRHTENPLENLSKGFKKFLLAFLSLGLLYTGAFACMGGGAGPGGGPIGGEGGISPVGGIGSGGMGAPPLAIPAPEALNMTAIIVAAPDSGGNSTVTVSPGVGPTGDFIVVKNRGDIAALTPLRKLFLGSAYAAGQTVTRLILPGGDTFTIGAAAGEELEFFHCLKSDVNRCSQGFLISVPATGTTAGDTTKPSTPPTGSSIKSMTTDPGTGNTYIIKGSSRKKWDWTRLFLGTAHAETYGDNGLLVTSPTVTVQPNVLPVVQGFQNPALQNYIANVPLDLYTPATCPSLPPGTSLVPDPSLSGKTCSISMAQGNGADPKDVIEGRANSTFSPLQAVIDIPNCDPNQSGLTFFKDGTTEKLAVFSANVLWIVTLKDKKIVQKVVYWSKISKVQYISGNLFTTLNDPTKADFPSFAINHECRDTDSSAAFNGIKDVGGFAVSGGSFAMTATYTSNSCLITGGVGQEFNSYYKINESCQAEPLTAIVFLKTAYVQTDHGLVYCGDNYAVIKPSTKQIYSMYIKSPAFTSNPSTYPAYWLAACSTPTDIKPLTVADAGDLKSLAFNGGDTLAILDVRVDGTYLVSYSVANDAVKPEKSVLSYQTTVKIEGTGATTVLWSPALSNFITDATTPEGALSLTPTRTMRRTTSTITVEGAE